jgi:hypothetical protein
MNIQAYKLRARLTKMRKTWRRELMSPKPGTTFIDGIVFGLTLAINEVTKFEKGEIR